MNTMSETQQVSDLHVKIHFPAEDLSKEEFEDYRSQVVALVNSIFEDEGYSLDVTVYQSDELRVEVHTLVLPNDETETSWMKPDHIASQLIQYRIEKFL